MRITARNIESWAHSDQPRSLLNVSVTPEMAKHLLRFNTSGKTNRHVSKARVSLISQAILDNRWVNTGASIVMSSAGVLNDGQHRLLAVMQSGVACEMDLRFGIPRAAAVYTDDNRKRTAGNVLTITGHAYAVDLASAARILLAYQGGLPSAIHIATTNARIVEAVESWPELPHCARIMDGLSSPLRNAVTTALAFCALRTANEASALEFFQILESGEGNTRLPPITLRRYLLEATPPGLKRVRGTLDAFAAGINAWNAWQDNKPAPRLPAWQLGKKFPICKGLAF